MKKFIVSVIFVYLLLMFLIYSGIFRNFTDPIVVTKYYFDCLKNREGFLTYKVSSFPFFNEDKSGKLYKKYKMYLVKNIIFNLLVSNETYAFVEAKINYNDNTVNFDSVELEKKESIWHIKRVFIKD